MVVVKSINPKISNPANPNASKYCFDFLRSKNNPIKGAIRRRMIIIPKK